MRLPSGFRASGDDLETGHGQRPYGRRCNSGCNASANAQQAGSGALIGSSSSAISAVALVAGTYATLVTFSISVQAGDVVLAWGNPTVDGDDGVTSVSARIQVDSATPTGGEAGVGVPADGETSIVPVYARHVATATGTISLTLQARTTGAAGNTSASGIFMYAHYRSPPV